MSEEIDRNWCAFQDFDSDRTITTADWAPPPDCMIWDDLYKASNVSHLTAVGLDIPKSRENSVDCVRGLRYRFIKCTIHGSVVLKGALDGALFSGCRINGTMELGQFDKYWRFGRHPTTNVELCDCTSDSAEITIWLWDADEPKVISTKVRIRRVPLIIWLPYFLFRALCVRFFP